MDKKQELFDIIKAHPERRLVAMFSNEGNSDYCYSLGEVTKVEVTEITEHDDRVYFSDEKDALREDIEGDLFDELYGNEPYSRVYTDEENEELERLSEEKLNKYEWEPVIAIYISN